MVLVIVKVDVVDVWWLLHDGGIAHILITPSLLWQDLIVLINSGTSRHLLCWGCVDARGLKLDAPVFGFLVEWKCWLNFLGLGRKSLSLRESFSLVLRLLSRILLLEDFLDFFTVDVHIWVQHSVVLSWQYIVNLYSPFSKPTSSSLRWPCHAYIRLVYQSLRRLLKLWKLNWVLLKSNGLEYWYGKWPCERLIGLACDSEFDIVHVNWLLLVIRLAPREASILLVDLGFLQYLRCVVMHELQKLVDYVFLIVFNSYRTQFDDYKDLYPASPSAFPSSIRAEAWDPCSVCPRCGLVFHRYLLVIDATAISDSCLPDVPLIWVSLKY